MSTYEIRLLLEIAVKLGHVTCIDDGGVLRAQIKEIERGNSIWQQSSN